MLRIVDVPGKNFGVVASRKISAGTLVLSESPIIEVPQYANHYYYADLILPQLQVLGSRSKEEFFALSNNFKEMRPIEGIVKTNAMPHGKDSPTGGISLKCSRFNHSCTANAAYSWNANIDQKGIKFAIIGGLAHVILGDDNRRTQYMECITVTADAPQENIVATMTKIPGMTPTWCDLDRRAWFQYKEEHLGKVLTLRVFPVKMNGIQPYFLAGGCVLPPHYCFMLKVHAVAYRNGPQDAADLKFLMQNYRAQLMHFGSK